MRGRRDMALLLPGVGRILNSLFTVHWHPNVDVSLLLGKDESSSYLLFYWLLPRRSKSALVTAPYVASTDTIWVASLLLGGGQSPDSPLGIFWHDFQMKGEGHLITARWEKPKLSTDIWWQWGQRSSPPPSGGEIPGFSPNLVMVEA